MSKLILFDFECPNGHSYDDLVQPDVHQAPCPTCGQEGTRQVSAPRFDPRMGIDATGFPTMGDKWARVRKQRKIVEERRAAEHGPDRWGASGADVIR